MRLLVEKDSRYGRVEKKPLLIYACRRGDLVHQPNGRHTVRKPPKRVVMNSKKGQVRLGYAAIAAQSCPKFLHITRNYQMSME